MIDYFPFHDQRSLQTYRTDLRHLGAALDLVTDQHPREIEGLLDVSQAHPQHVDAVSDEPGVVREGLRRKHNDGCFFQMKRPRKWTHLNVIETSVRLPHAGRHKC